MVSLESPVYKQVGYCPQEECIWPDVTVLQHIKFYAIIHGIREDTLDELEFYFFSCIWKRTHGFFCRFCELLLRMMNMTEHKNKKTKDCSGGTRKKLCYILSLISKHHDLFLLTTDSHSSFLQNVPKSIYWTNQAKEWIRNREDFYGTQSCCPLWQVFFIWNFKNDI